MAGFLDQVRTGCRKVVEQSSHVKINFDGISAYAGTLPLEQMFLPELDPVHHYLGHGEDTTAFLLTLDTINFGSGYFPHLRKRPGMSGYFTIASSLCDHFREHGPFSARELAEATPDQCTRIFHQDPDNVVVSELMRLFARALNDLGRYVSERFNGSFSAVVDAAEGSAEKFVKLLTAMPCFNDIEVYDGLLVPFFKRAQLAAADLSLAFRGEGPGRFYDLDRLTIFADNLVPHVLRVDRILIYDETLVSRIDRGEIIPSGCHEEVEIRANAVHAVELVVQELRRTGHSVKAMDLDYLLWNRGQQPHYKEAHPRHRTRTVFY